MNLPKHIQQRIENESPRFERGATFTGGSITAAYKSGATSEALRAQVLAEALEKIVNRACRIDDRYVIGEFKDLAKSALEEYNKTI